MKQLILSMFWWYKLGPSILFMSYNLHRFYITIFIFFSYLPFAILSEILLQVGYHTKYENTRCFLLERTDGTVEDFSYHKCVYGALEIIAPGRARSYYSKWLESAADQLASGDLRMYILSLSMYSNYHMEIIGIYTQAF